MKITFKKTDKIELFVKINKEYKDEIVKEEGVKTLFLKCDESMNLRKTYLLIRKMVTMAKSAKVKSFTFDFDDFSAKGGEPASEWKFGITDSELAEIVGTQLDYANYEFNDYKTPPKDGFNLIKEVIITSTEALPPYVKEAILKGNIIADEVNKTRTLSNIPGGDMTPKILAQKAKEAVKGLPVQVTVLGEKEMEKEKMKAILSVGCGSDEESKFIIMEYFGGDKKDKPIVLVGKGVTFDSGGLSLKPTTSMVEMNMDMSGGASVIHTLALVAKMKLKKNVIGLIPSVENFISGKSYRPGDVIRSMSGQTIEVLNTDAEGRVILADALTYAKKYNPSVVIDIATLTGSACVALGERMSAVFTEDDELCTFLEKAGNITGEYIWRLPLWEEYENEIKGNLGDWTNMNNKNSPYGDAIYSAVFLHQFIKGCRWAHIDMAPRMTSMPGDFLARGAAGSPVRLLYKFIENEK